jgi:hypothetical protein
MESHTWGKTAPSLTRSSGRDAHTAGLFAPPCEGLATRAARRKLGIAPYTRAIVRGASRRSLGARSPRSPSPTQRILTARAASNTTMVKEIIAWSIMSSLAHRESTGASVGERAVLVLKARNR